MTHAIRPVDFDNLKTMTYQVTDRVARITFNRPEKGNAIVADTPLELSALVERADLDPNVHVILVSGRGDGFCAGFDLSAYADGTGSAGGTAHTRARCWTVKPRPSTTCPTSPGTR
ncbi:enoyl-CoA hydratase/isomerase family protein [Mycobacterium kansasii]|uniref:Enoyl-CoA hydratase/isomerase family protein n=1 Tax=Mycobacterium kansasii TaxID=1768 RepID=A0A1V3WFE1_MYCKA|nr:enoyl-CoA hydratase/isomerase family protein [Mycobacterium kansasii]